SHDHDDRRLRRAEKQTDDQQGQQPKRRRKPECNASAQTPALCQMLVHFDHVARLPAVATNFRLAGVSLTPTWCRTLCSAAFFGHAFLLPGPPIINASRRASEAFARRPQPSERAGGASGCPTFEDACSQRPALAQPPASVARIPPLWGTSIRPAARRRSASAV